MKIKILGTGCEKCKRLYKNAVEAVEKKGIEADIEKVEDIVTIMSYGGISTPILIIDEEIVVNGRVAKVDEIIKFL